MEGKLNKILETLEGQKITSIGCVSGQLVIVTEDNTVSVSGGNLDTTHIVVMDEEDEILFNDNISF
jgi:hypothetical protein